MKDKYENSLAELNNNNSNLKSQLSQHTENVNSVKKQLSSTEAKVSQLSRTNASFEAAHTPNQNLFADGLFIALFFVLITFKLGSRIINFIKKLSKVERPANRKDTKAKKELTFNEEIVHHVEGRDWFPDNHHAKLKPASFRDNMDWFTDGLFILLLSVLITLKLGSRIIKFINKKICG